MLFIYKIERSNHINIISYGLSWMWFHILSRLTPKHAYFLNRNCALMEKFPSSNVLFMSEYNLVHNVNYWRVDAKLFI